MSEDHLFDLLAILVFVVLLLALAALGLAGSVRSPSVFWRVVGYAVAAGGTWIGVVASMVFVQCPAQDETCGHHDLVGDVGTQLAVVLALTFMVLIAWWRWKLRRSRSSQPPG